MFYFLKQCNIEKVLLSTNISFGKETINTSLVTCIMIIKLNHYIQCFLKQGLIWKVMVDKANGCISWLKMILIKKNIILSGMKSVLISKKGLVLSLSIIFLKTEIKPHGDEVTGFYDNQMPKVDSNHTCLAVHGLDYALKKDENYWLKVFLKECKYIE